MAQVVLYGRKGCHLCEMVEIEIRATGRIGRGLIVVDVDRDQVLLEKYLLRIPVVTVAGKEVFEVMMMDPHGGWKERLRSVLQSP